MRPTDSSTHETRCLSLRVSLLAAAAVTGAATTACGGGRDDPPPRFSVESTDPSPSAAPETLESPIPTESTASTEPTALPDDTTDDTTGPVPDAAGLPSELVGTWQGLDQGSAEVVFRFHEDGTFESAEVLMQERPSGVFSFSVGAAGTVELVGDQLVMTQERGREALVDPDSPSSNFDRPLSPLEEEIFTWSFDGALLVLSGESGPITFQRIDG